MHAAVVGTQLIGTILGMKTPVCYDTIHAGDWRIGLIVVSWCHPVVILDLCRAYTVIRVGRHNLDCFFFLVAF